MISPLTVGAGVAAVMAGPPLYQLAASGQLDSTSAIARGLLVAGVCTVGASYIQDLMRRYEIEADRKHLEHLEQLAAEERARQQEQAQQAQEARQRGQSQS